MNKTLLLMGLLASVMMPQALLAGDDTDDATRATFQVEKDWDGPGQGYNEAEVEVTISCNTGLPLEQTASIDQDDGVIFVVESFNSGDLDCEITESVPAFYDVAYCLPDPGCDETNTYESSCEFEGVEDGDGRGCRIINTPNPVEVGINKEWVVTGELNGVSTEYCITLTCGTEIVDCNDGSENQLGCTIHQYGENPNYVRFCNDDTDDTSGDDWWADVVPGFEDESAEENPLDCEVSENVSDSSVETSNPCEVEIAIGEGYDCTITNTVFFEGVPVLNPYGLAVLILSMLGLGFVAYRRFA